MNTNSSSSGELLLLLRMIARKRGVSRLLLLPADSVFFPTATPKDSSASFRGIDSTISGPPPKRRTVLDFGMLY